jgi:hypothetical protein
VYIFVYSVVLVVGKIRKIRFLDWNKGSCSCTTGSSTAWTPAARWSSSQMWWWTPTPSSTLWSTDGSSLHIWTRGVQTWMRAAATRLTISVRRIRIFMGLLDPDLLFRGTAPEPWFLLFCDFWMTFNLWIDVNAPSKSLKQKNVEKISIISIWKLCSLLASLLFSRQSFGTKQHCHQVSHIYSITVHVYCIQNHKHLFIWLYFYLHVCVVNEMQP